jgi:hypothetical protein
MNKITLLITFALITLNSFSQNNSNHLFGKLTNEEINLQKYKLDTTANALVLYESGNTTFKIKNDKIIISTDFYKKIKLFNKDGFENATFKIRLYNTKDDYEKLDDLKAITHNNLNKTVLSKSQIFEEKINDNWKEVKFTMPNLKEGSIVEVKYTIESPFKFNLTGWTFQSNIPKKYSIYTAKIPGNYVYNRSLKGYLKLAINTSSIEKKCFKVPGYSSIANCENITYAMEHIPAFVEEDYMTTKNNYLSKIKFELSEFLWFDGTRQKFTTSWEAADKEFRTDKSIGTQLKKINYFEDKLPPFIDTLTTQIDKAKAIYTFIQKHFTWNEKYSIFKNVKVKEAFEDKTGNVAEINISLINALKAKGLNTELVLISTRNNGLATKLYPVITDFNYVIAKLNINGESFLLDATNKLAPFGILPFRCLNSYGRVMDFENESYWIDIVPEQNSKSQLNVGLVLNQDGSISGKLRKIKYGYNALNRREEILHKKEDDIVSDFENNFNNLEVVNYTIENKEAIDKPIIETFEILIEDTENTTTHYLNPLFDESFKINPFKQQNRLYPVDFGYPRRYIVNFSLEVPDNFDIISYPKSTKIVLEKESAKYSLLTRKHQNFKISLKSTLLISNTTFYNFEYQPLKELFKKTINSQKEPIVLKKNSI